MSMLVGAAAPVNYLWEDLRDAPAQYHVSLETPLVGESVGEIPSFANEYWPKSGMAGDAGDVGPMRSTRWGRYETSFGAGGSSRYGMSGVTRDSFGSAVGYCTVKLYLTATDALIDATVSDPLGNFLLNTPYYPNTHYIVAHKGGSPDIDGVTRNTLIGA